MKQYELVKNGISEYVIVHAAEPMPAEITASKELQKYIQKMSGVNLPIVGDNEAVTEKEIVVGKTNREKEGDFDRDAWGPDGYIIKTAQGTIWLLGKNPIGTVYSVHTFLEDYLGCRFYTAEVEKVPKSKDLLVDERGEDKRDTQFIFRDIQYLDYEGTDISVKRKLNIEFWGRRIPEEYGGGITYARDEGGHTFEQFVPPSVYFDEHPEYFAMNEEGVRVKDDICMSHPDTIRIVIDAVKSWLSENPKVRAIAVSQNDIKCPCMCENCRKIYEEEGGAFSGTLIRLCNAVGDAIKEEYPNVYVDTYAYQYTRSVPTKTKPANNVIISYCTIEACFSHGIIDNCVQRECKSYVDGSGNNLLEDLLAWGKVTNTLCIRDYMHNCWELQQTFPNFESIRKNMALYADCNAMGLKIEGAPRIRSGEFEELRSYLISKLLWDPYMSKETYYAHMDDFLEGVYGPGGKYIRRYIDIAQELTKDTCFYLIPRYFEMFPMPAYTKHEESELPNDLTVSMVKNYRETDWKKYWNWYKDIKESPITKEGELCFKKAMEMAENDVQRDQIDKIESQVIYIKSHYYREQLDAGNEMFPKMITNFIAANAGEFSKEEEENLPEIIRAYACDVFLAAYAKYNRTLAERYVSHGIMQYRVNRSLEDFDRLTFTNAPFDWMVFKDHINI